MDQRPLQREQRRKQKRKNASGSAWAVKPREVDDLQVVPFKCHFRSDEHIGKVNCGCSGAAKVYQCSNPDIESDYCTAHSHQKGRAKGIKMNDGSVVTTGERLDLPVCLKCSKSAPFRWIDKATICITYMDHRLDSLKRLEESIEKYLPGVKVEKINTEGNLSKARNTLAAHIDTPYYIIMEEDFEVTRATAVGLDEAFGLLESDPSLDAVGGSCIQRHRRQLWSHNIIVNSGRACGVVSDDKRVAPNGTEYVKCEMLLNWGMFKTSVFTEVGYNEDIPIGGEHWEFLYRCKVAGLNFAYLKGLEVIHHRTGSSDYLGIRRRDYSDVAYKQHGLRWVVGGGLLNPDTEAEKLPAEPKLQSVVKASTMVPDSLKPNILVTGPGRSGTSILTAMIESLGWHCSGDADYKEDGRTQQAHKLHSKGGDAAGLLSNMFSSLPEPWVVKDPRIGRAIGPYIEVFRAVRHKPLLVLIDRDVDAIRESMSNTPWNGEAEQMIAKANEGFKRWPWRKVRIKYEDLANAACMWQCGERND